MRDENHQINVAYVTYLFIALNISTWVGGRHGCRAGVVTVGLPARFATSVCHFDLIPADLISQEFVRTRQICAIDGKPDWYSLVSSVFMHGSWIYLIGNILFQWIFGNNVADLMGSFRFALFYLL